jgi:hypothetical protein
MADEKVNVLIKFDAKTRQLDTAIAKMALLNKYEKRFASGQQLERFASRGSAAAGQLASKWKKSFDLIDGAVKMTGKFLTGFLKTAIKGVIAQMGLFGATMIGVHATFAAGQFIMKAYRGAMQLVAGGAAAATMAIAAFSSALREQQAAMFAYRGKGANEFGSGMNQTRMGMRNLQADASLATLGVEALNKAYGTMSKSMNVAQINASTSTIRALMDFGSAGQDPAKGLEQVAVVIEMLSNKKKNISEVITEAKKLGPEMEEALKTANVKTKAEFEKLLMSGQLAKKGGVSGQFGEINNTLIGQLKSYFTRIRVEFADFGDQFLEPLKVAFEKIFDIIRRDLTRIEATIMQTVGTQGMIDGFVTATDKISNFMVKLMREYLPKTVGMFGRISEWMEDFKRGWNIVLDRLRPLITGARVLYNALSPIWQAIKDGLNQIFDFNDQLIGNEANFKEFGTNIAAIINVISGALANMRSIFETIAPFINDVMKGFGDVFKMVTSFLTGGAGKSFIMALAPLIAMQTLGSKLGATSGRMAPVLGSFSKAVTIQAQTATIVAAGMSGRVGAFSGGGTGGGSRVMTPLGYVSGGDTIAAQQGFASGGGGSFGSANAEAVAAAATGGLKAGADAATNYARAFAIKDQKMQQEKNKGFSSGAADDKQKAAAAAEAAKKTAVMGFRDLKNMPLSGLKGFLKASSDLTKSKYGDDIKERKDVARRQIADQNALLNGPLAYLSPIRKMMEPITGGIGGTLAGGTPTNEQYMQATGGLGSKYETPEDRRARKEGLRTEREMRRELLQERRKSRLKLAGATAEGGIKKAYGAARGFGAYLKGPAFDPYGDGGKGAYVDVGAARNEIFERRQNRMELQNTLMGRTAARIGYRRDMARLNRGEGTKFGRAMSRVGTSGGARFGVGAGLGLASQYAPEEMRGAMAMGAMAGQFDPRLGIAVAGVGGAMTARGAGKGALAGAAGGAAVGAFFSPLGAAIGAGLGAMVGGIMGAANKAKHEMKIAGEIGKAALMNFFGDLTGEISRQFSLNEEQIARGEQFAPGTKGALQGMAGDAASKISNLENEILGKNVNANDAARKARQLELARVLNTGDLTGSALQTAQAEFKNLKRGRTAINLTGSEAQAKVRDIFSRQKEFGIKMSPKELEATTKSGDTATKYLDSIIGGDTGLSGALTRIQGQNDARVTALGLQFGKTGPELESLARSIGEDLYDATISYDELVQKLSLSMVLTSQQMKNAATDLFIGGSNPFKTTREANEAQQRIDQSTRGLSDKLNSGKLGAGEKESEINAYMESSYADILALSGGDPIKAAAIFQESFGQGTAGGQFAKGEALEGLGVDFYQTTGFMDAVAKNRSDQTTLFGDKLIGLAGQQNKKLDSSEIKTQLANMSTEERVAAFTKIRDTESLKDQDLNEFLKILKFDTEKLTPPEKIITEELSNKLNDVSSDVAEALRDGTEINSQLKTALEISTGLSKQFFTSLTDAPQWWKDGLVFDGTKLAPPEKEQDTATPRGGAFGDTTTSRLSQTMNRHSSLNSQVPGNRSITSAWRDTNLGSINSDHVTGRAYDLVGQNLGKYATIAREGGGFAEFHGNFSKRHLHVVPGAGATGDASTPSGKMISGSGSGSTVNNYYNVEINGANMSPEAIANVVMQKLDSRNKAARERA